MRYLQRSKARPDIDALTRNEANSLASTFDPYAGEVIVNGEVIHWKVIEELEVVVAPHAAGAAGWLVRNLVHAGERYHVGLYYGTNEAVLPNVTLEMARYVARCVAYYAPLPVRYKGPDGLTPTVEE